MDYRGFWSYVHADDKAERGRIRTLARDIAAQFEMLSGEPLMLFLDKDAVKWGAEWQKEVDAGLASVAYFIPVMTPRYFLSAECRRELQSFARAATRLNIKELILPLLYVDVAAVHEENPNDELISLVKTFLWEDWRDLRFADAESESYRRGIAKLANRLIEANRQAEKPKDTSSARAIEADEAGDDAPGLMDKMIIAEEALPKLSSTLDSVSSAIREIGSIMALATRGLHERDHGNTGIAGRLETARRLARDLKGPADLMIALGSEFTAQLHDIDFGIRTLLTDWGERAVNIQAREDGANDLSRAVTSMAVVAKKGLGQVQEMVNSIRPVENLSRDLRPVLRRLRQGLTALVEGGEIIDGWVKLIEQSGSAV